MTDITHTIMRNIKRITEHRIQREGREPLLTIVFNAEGYIKFRRIWPPRPDIIPRKELIYGCHYAIRPQKELVRVIER